MNNLSNNYTESTFKKLAIGFVLYIIISSVAMIGIFFIAELIKSQYYFFMIILT